MKFYLGLQQIQLEIPDSGCKYPFVHFQGASAPLAHAWRRRGATVLSGVV